MSGIPQQSRYLFIADELISGMDNVQRRLNPVDKVAGNPLLSANSARHERLIFLYGSVLHEQGQFRMWYESIAPLDASRRAATAIGYATSQDGYIWERPSLGLVDWFGSKDNNLVFSTGYKGNAHNVSVLRDERDPDPDRRYKMLYYDNVRPIDGTWLAYSPDGLHWRRHQDNPVWPGVGDVIPTIFDEQTGRFVCYAKKGLVVRGGPDRRCVGIGFSDDLIHWRGSDGDLIPSPQIILLPDEEDDASAQALGGTRTEFYGMSGFPYGGLYLGFLWVFRTSVKPDNRGWDDGPIDVQLTYSLDGSHWQRAFSRQPLIPLGPRSSFDDGMIFTPNRPLIVGDEIWIYYSGFNVTHGLEPQALGEQYGAAIGLAKLRLDGFVSIDARHAEGSVTTVPIRCTGKQLVINADARDGYVLAEVLDSYEQPLAGFGREACEQLRGDYIRHALTWSGASLAAYVGQELRIKFYVRNAKLYSFGFQ
jgi:hypothetical protein